MDFKELLEKYHILYHENIRLKEENKQLKDQLENKQFNLSHDDFSSQKENTAIVKEEQIENETFSVICNSSSTSNKIKLFISLFKGRDDVYAKRWENLKTGKKGYSPVCLNQWKAGLCHKPKISCLKCTNKSYAVLDSTVIDSHLRGHFIVGIYPMLPDETCYFLAIDFDEGDWQNDIQVVKDICKEFEIPFAVERSQSGKGGHVWFFFESRIPAVLARKFGSSLLTHAMNRRHEIKFKSYDRLFPSQDTLPRSGLGNLIALPLQKSARKNCNSEFINDNFESYSDQWAFLSTVRKLDMDNVESHISKLCHGNEFGVLKIDPEEEQKPWETTQIKLHETDFPSQVDIVKANMLYIPKKNISQSALNRLKRLASFKNPMFFKKQAMRLSTHGLPPVISCADVTSEYLCLPRGCDVVLKNELEKYGCEVQFIDKTNIGNPIKVEFKGHLRDEQVLAFRELLKNDIGILSGTTAFGKTVVAIKIIAERKVNTLILVDKISLLSQWKQRLKEFLIFNETLPETESKKGRKKSIIGQLGAGKNTLNGIVDIAVMQSVSRLGEVKEYVKNYGMIIADECHHVGAFNYENILKTTNAKFIYGQLHFLPSFFKNGIFS